MYQDDILERVIRLVKEVENNSNVFNSLEYPGHQNQWSTAIQMATQERASRGHQGPYRSANGTASAAIWLPSGDPLNYPKCKATPAPDYDRKTIRGSLELMRSPYNAFYNVSSGPLAPIDNIPTFHNEFANVRIDNAPPVSISPPRQISPLIKPPGYAPGGVSSTKYCKFCKKSGETSKTFLSHNLTNCHVLEKFTCDNCMTKGHTRSYCPNDSNTSVVRILSEHNRIMGFQN